MSNRNPRIIHSVIFSLKHAQGSEQERRFLEDGRSILSGIPVVNDFQVFRQVSPKNDYDFGFSMVFDSQADYEAYNDHPAHSAFVNERWKVEVEKFLEIDYEAI
ncbi:Dabb family protein [Cohnella panacarvi]|uniref:Dabb family protein n=1 Tax=Cohnella panacarvi TaxID=400776 RepID=UPI00047CCD8F|nr:Dabb family protein [Cohnella panacarvi]